MMEGSTSSSSSSASASSDSATKVSGDEVLPVLLECKLSNEACEKFPFLNSPRHHSILIFDIKGINVAADLVELFGLTAQTRILRTMDQLPFNKDIENRDFKLPLKVCCVTLEGIPLDVLRPILTWEHYKAFNMASLAIEMEVTLETAIAHLVHHWILNLQKKMQSIHLYKAVEAFLNQQFRTKSITDLDKVFNRCARVEELIRKKFKGQAQQYQWSSSPVTTIFGEVILQHIQRFLKPNSSQLSNECMQEWRNVSPVCFLVNTCSYFNFIFKISNTHE